MGCLKGESDKKHKGAKFTCDKCGAAAKKKAHVCQPVELKIKKKKEKSKGGKKDPG